MKMIIILLIVLLLPVNAHADYTPSQVRKAVKHYGGIENFLKKIAEQTNANLPMNLDYATDMLSVIAVGRTLNYVVQLKNHSVNQIEDIKYFREIILKNARNLMCTQPVSSVAITEFNAVYKYSVVDKTNRYVTSYEISKTECFSVTR